MAFFIDESNFSSNYKNWTTLANGEYAPLLLEECLPYVHYQSFPILDCKGKVLGERKRAIHGFFLKLVMNTLVFLFTNQYITYGAHIYIAGHSTHRKQMLWFLLQSSLLFEEDTPVDISKDPDVLLQWR